MIEREGKQLRHEFKYNLDPHQYQILRSRVKALMQPDKYAGPDGKYHIRSLYFDDMKNSAHFEKLSGISRRKKYRIRIYDFKDDVIKLEKKSKMDDYISKEIAFLTRKETDKILSRDIDFMLNSDNKLFREFYLESRRNYLKPVVIVDYHREAYTYPVGNVRITFDLDLKTALNSTDIFDKDAITVQMLKSTDVILEVKYDSVLPEAIRGLFPDTIRPRSAIGKFVISKGLTPYNEWEEN
jgi:VTC domain